MSDQSWNERGARAHIRARDPAEFVKQHVASLPDQKTHSPESKLKRRSSSPSERTFTSEQEFWAESTALTFSTVLLKDFRLSDWFPRSPGVYWSRYGRQTRDNVYGGRSINDPKLGHIFEPNSKMALIEEGGIGTVRLRPRRVDTTDCWFATAVTDPQCAGGIPLLVPHSFIREGAIEWGGSADLVGTVRFLQDAELHDIAASVHHASPLIIFVEELKGRSSRERSQNLTITPVALFDQSPSNEAVGRYGPRDLFGYTFVQSSPDAGEVDDAAGWIQLYAEKFGGNVITNFDERLPRLADAPLSYQRLVKKTYDRTVIANLHLEKLADRIDSVKTEYVNYGDVGAMGDGARSDGTIFRRMSGRGKRDRNEKAP